MQNILKPLEDSFNFISCEFKTDKSFIGANSKSSTNVGFFIEIPKESVSYTTQLNYIHEAYKMLHEFARKLWNEQQVKINWDSVVFRYCL
mgnify:CR=1 FL=1